MKKFYFQNCLLVSLGMTTLISRHLSLDQLNLQQLACLIGQTFLQTLLLLPTKSKKDAFMVVAPSIAVGIASTNTPNFWASYYIHMTICLGTSYMALLQASQRV